MYAIVIDGDVSFHTGIPTLERMQEVVGGWVTTALRMDSPTRSGTVNVTVFCNDEGLLMKLPIYFVRMTDRSPIAGDLIITAEDLEGETIEAQIKELTAALSQFGKLMKPITEYEI